MSKRGCVWTAMSLGNALGLECENVMAEMVKAFRVGKDE